MKRFLIIAWLLALVGIADAQKTCTRVSATSQNCTATISWTAGVVDATHDAATGYQIRRSDGGGAKVQIGVTLAPLVSIQNVFTDAGNVSHCWDVLATTANPTPSAPSTQACWTSPAITGAAPNAPVGVTIAAISSTGLRITWDDVANETGYEVYGRTAKGPDRQYSKLIALAADVTTWDWTLRRRFTSYCVEVLATGNPNSPFSNPVCATTSK